MRSILLHRILTLLVVLSLCLSCTACSTGIEYSPYFTSSDITLTNYSPSASNYGQIDDSTSSCQLTYSNGKLYVFYPRTPTWNALASWEEPYARIFKDYVDFHKTLAYIEDGKLVPIAKVSRLIGGYGDYIYYFGYDSDNTDRTKTLYVYNSITQLEKELLYADVGYSRIAYDFSFDGLLRMQIEEKNNTTVFHIRGDEILTYFSDETPLNTIQLENNTYTFTLQTICRNGEDISNQFPSSPMRSAYPVGDGIIIHNENAHRGQIVSYICSDGDIISLFPEMEYDFIHHSLAVYEKYVFVSFKRYRAVVDYLITEEYENDTLSGTYRIDIRDFSRTKISDQCFDSMFIFDDTGIFGNNGSGTYKIDFDGNLLLTIIEG